ncbi:disease resistance-like protein CSA1 [Hevea brasiliensis]|nr:disease resistance-like protein CSA1 [Hevea brasiliensis]
MPRGIKYLDLSGSGVEEWSPSSIQFFDNHVFVNISHCENLRSLPRIIYCNTFSALDIRFCPNLIMAPQIMEMLNEIASLIWFTLFKISGSRWHCTCRNSPDIVSLSSLELLSLRDAPIEELPSSIGCLSSLVSLNLQRCKKLKSLPNSICELKCLKTLLLSGCSNLEKLPPLYGLCSLKNLYLDGTALVKIPLDIFSLLSLRVLFLNDTPIEELPSSIGYELNFCNCVNLDQNARGTIMADAIQRIKELAFARSYGAFYPSFLVGLPGSKMPEWLSCEGPGDLIETSFPPGCFNNMFLGFVFCAILEFKAPVVHVRHLQLRCRSSFKNNNGDRVAMFSSKYFCLEDTIESDHVIFWYDGHGIFSLDWLKQNCDMENKAKFDLEPESVDMTQLEVKRFGFHLLYDKVELNKCNPYICREANFLEQLEETANANNKRSREDFYSSNINGNQEVETHPKRLRPNFFMEDYFSNAQDGINYDATMVPSSSSCEFAPKFYKFL